MKHYLTRAQEVFDDHRLNWDGFLKFHTTGSNLKSQAESFTFMKPHLFNYLRELNIEDVKDLKYPRFKNIYFNEVSKQNLDEGLRDLPDILTVKEVVETIQKDGGFAVIPHLGFRFIPKKARKNRGELFQSLRERKRVYKSFLKYCESLGVWGIEMYYYREWKEKPQIIEEINAYIKDLAKDKFRFTCGDPIVTVSIQLRTP